MQLFNRVPQFKFMAHRRLATSASILLIVVSLVSLGFRGLQLGLDFTGGILIEVAYDGPADLDGIRQTLGEFGYNNAVVQNFGTADDVLIRLPPTEGAEEGSTAGGTEVMAALRAKDPSVEDRRIESVGSQIGDELIEAGGLAMLFVLVGVFAYIMLRFRWKFAAGAISALVHDVIITFGFFSVLGLEFDQSVLAAVLAVIGYSLNDTIVVYDRIRENFRAMRRGTASDVIDASINQTLARTLITALTTLLVLVALYLLGGQTVQGFAIALIVGIVVGTYSSIYIASAAALALDVSPADLIPPKREEVDDLP
jgi:preprotein translocase subunit SecF